MSLWWWKDGTNKVSTTGVDRVAHNADGTKRRDNGQGERRQILARGSGIQGLRGMLGSRPRASMQRAQRWISGGEQEWTFVQVDGRYITGIERG